MENPQEISMTPSTAKTKTHQHAKVNIFATQYCPPKKIRLLAIGKTCVAAKRNIPKAMKISPL